MITTPLSTLLTAEEFYFQHGHERMELVQGKVVATDLPGLKHGIVCWNAALILGMFIKQHRLGHLATNDTLIRVAENPDTVRGADVLFISYDLLPQEAEIPEGILPFAPELVVEVRSPSNRTTDLMTKTTEYLNAGVRVVLILDPESRTAITYRPDGSEQTFQADDTLTIPDLLPGLQIRVQQFFD